MEKKKTLREKRLAWSKYLYIGNAYLIICGTVTFELSSKAFIISPLQRMLSMHCRTDSAE